MRKSHAFTLVELLVVIGIIGILIAILLPTLRNVRASGQAARCASNLRQLYAAQLGYASDSRGRLTTVDFAGAGNQWVARLSKYLAHTGEPGDTILQCPSISTDASSPPSAFLPPSMSYGVNSHVMIQSWRGRRDARMDSARIILMGDKLLNGDEWLVSEDGAYYTTDVVQSDRPDGTWIEYEGHVGSRSRRHGGGNGGRTANMLMADGHVDQFGARDLKLASGHWYWGSPQAGMLVLPLCPCCPP